MAFPGRPPADAEQPGRRDSALIIAIEDYLVVDDVPGARANAADWDRWFEARGVPVARVVMLRDAEAVRESILQQATQLAGETPAGGTLWVVYIGHGAPAADGQDGVLVGADAQQKAAILYARSVGQKELLGALQGAQAETVVVLDACFSGKGAGGRALVPGLQPLVPTQTRVEGRVTVLSAGAGDEFAGALPGLERPAFSYLTLGALHGWRPADGDGDGAITLGEAVAYSRGALRRVVKDRRQTPEIQGPLATRAMTRVRGDGPDLRAVGDDAVDSAAEAPARGGELAGLVAAEKKEEEARQLRTQAAQAHQAEVERRWRDADLQFLVQRASGRAVPAVRALMDELGRHPLGNPLQAEMQAALDQLVARSLEEATPERPALVLVPAGSFVQGNPDGEPSERPRKVTLKRPFFMMKTEVTQAQYQAVMGTNPSRPAARDGQKRCGDCPVENLSWHDAVALANALSAREQLSACYRGEGDATRRLDWCTGYRLPTEAEWEWAAQGATAEGDEDRFGARPVGRGPASPRGLVDLLLGNHEWCEDWYDGYAVGAVTDPRGPDQGTKRVMRGYHLPGGSTVTRRWASLPDRSYYTFGVRLVRGVPKVEK